MSTKPTLTTTAGAPVADNQNSITAGPRGPVLLQDYQLIEKLAHQNRERLPERTVHAKGWGAHGTLTITGDISKYTKAKALQPGAKTPMIARFSTVAGELGAADAERDVRGFALKFYTEEGNWDLVGNNTPVFFVRDPYKFPDFIHTQKRHPKTNMRSPTAMWDFWSLSPESLHQVTILMSDRGLPVSVRHMNGYGSHTYSFINAKGERHWVKFHFKTMQGHKHWTNKEAAEVVGRTREVHAGRSVQRHRARRLPALEDAGADHARERRGQALVQSLRPHQGVAACRLPADRYRLFRAQQESGEYFQEIELAAFSPSNAVPGISWSPDKMLQARIFSYADAHRYRLGTHYEALPVNASKCPVHHYHKDGPMRFFPAKTGNVDAFYEPNSFNGAAQDERFAEPPLPISGDADRYNHRDGNDDYKQVTALFNLFDAGQKARLFLNCAEAMWGIPHEIAERQLAHFKKVHPDYEAGVRRELANMTRAKASETAQQQKMPQGVEAAE